MQCIRVMKKWDFHYVENLSWIRQHVNNAFLEEDAEFCYKSKSSLLIFKKVTATYLLWKLTQYLLFRAIWIVCNCDINEIRMLYTTLFCLARSIWLTTSQYKCMTLSRHYCRTLFTKTKRTPENYLKCTFIPYFNSKLRYNTGNILRWAKKGTKRTGWTTIVQKME